MKRLTVEEIADMTNDKDGRANIRAINKLFRQQDESHLWPIRSRFNVTERAIRKARKISQHNPCFGLEYASLLDLLMSEIINDPKNW